MYGRCFNVGNIEYGCEIYGPGKRTVIWFQGCGLGCKGCWNLQFQSFAPSHIIPRQNLLEMILSRGNGVTFLGGEPLQQTDNLLWLVKKLKEKNVHVMLYTGYEPDEIESDPMKKEACGMADILIPGKYREEERDTNLLWRGSRNQPLIYLGEKENTMNGNQVEITLSPLGEVTCLGYPSEEMSEFIRSLDSLSR